jgi:hypothetical protein
MIGSRTDPATRLETRADPGLPSNFFTAPTLSEVPISNSQRSILRAISVFVGYGISSPEQGWDDYKGD